MGTNQYPRIRTNMNDTIFHWRNHINLYGLRAPPGAVIFAQDNNDDSANGEIHVNDGQR